MFNWATSKLTALSETLAPPPSTPSHRFLSALSQSNESLALQILHDPHEALDLYASLNQRGVSSIHVAASYACLSVVREIIGRGVRVDITDYNGWTALHHASASSSGVDSLSVVKFLVEECGAAVLAKTNEGATAYDVAVSQSVRGYLLPRQLQLETKECLDNGGKGLMPGIDLGGCQVNYSNLAPPPVIGGPPVGAGPPPGGIAPQQNNYDPSAALMQPPPVRGIGASPRQPVQTPQMMSPAPMASSVSSISNYSSDPAAIRASEPVQQIQQQWQSPPVASKPLLASPAHHPVQQQPFQSPPVANKPADSPAQPIVQQQQPSTQTTQPETTPTTQSQPPLQQPNQQPEPAPKSAQSTGSYALRGGNANNASILSDTASGRKIYKPDGFHSSSNDKELQAKYGHVENSFEASRKAAVPPPPISGGAPIPAGTPTSSGGYNPYSAAPRAGGYIGGSGRARYPAYCAVSDSVSAPPSLSGSGYPYNDAAVPTYANFSQGLGQQQNTQQQWAGQQQQNVQPSAYAGNEAQPNAYGAGYNQQPAQHQQWQVDAQNQSANAYQQTQPPVQQQWQGETQQNQASVPAQQQWMGSAQPNQKPAFSPQPEPSATPSPPKQSQPIMASDAAASMFGTPHVNTPKKSVGAEPESLPSLPIESNTQELFGAPPTDSTPAKSEDAVNAFVSPPSASQPMETAAEQVKVASPSTSTEPAATDNIAHSEVEAVSNDAGSFFGSPARTETDANTPKDASSFFGAAFAHTEDAGEQSAESLEKPQTLVTGAAPQQPPVTAAAPAKSFGGLPPPPVIGGMKPMPTPSSFASPTGSSSLPPPPMVRSSPTTVKEEDSAADQMAEISLS